MQETPPQTILGCQPLCPPAHPLLHTQLADPQPPLPPPALPRSPTAPAQERLHWLRCELPPPPPLLHPIGGVGAKQAPLLRWVLLLLLQVPVPLPSAGSCQAASPADAALAPSPASGQIQCSPPPHHPYPLPALHPSTNSGSTPLHLLPLPHLLVQQPQGSPKPQASLHPSPLHRQQLQRHHLAHPQLPGAGGDSQMPSVPAVPAATAPQTVPGARFPWEMMVQQQEQQHLG